MKRTTVAIPSLILLAGVGVSAVLLSGSPAARTAAPALEPQLVRTLATRPEAVTLRVRSQGTVTPRTESRLLAEVAGQVIDVAPGLEPGAFFSKGDVLASIDPRDLELSVKRARAALTRSLAEHDFADAALSRVRALRDRGIASDAMLDEAERAARIAVARRSEAEVDLERAERDLQRTLIVAPFDGRTRERLVDVGGFVSTGSPLAQVYAVDFADVRLPIPDSEVAFLELPLGAEFDAEDAPEVILSARFAGERHTWSGRVLRTEAEIDPKTRMVTVVARVERPYASGAQPPLAAGMFVDAEILGRRLEDVVRVPRSALVADTYLWVVDGDNRLRRQRVEVLRFERETALIAGGLHRSHRVALIEPRMASEGLEVRALPQDEMIALDVPAPEAAS